MAQTEVKLLLNAIDNASKTIGGVTQEVGGLNKAAAVGSDFLSGMGVSLSALQNPAMLAGQALKFAHDAAVEGELATAKLDAAVQRAGSSFGITSQELQGMALEMANLTGVEDEAIMGAQAILLKFDAISTDTFPRVTQAALDLSVELGDMGSAAQLVGKLMQSPAEAVGLLERQVGKLTQAEKDHLETMVESGNIMGAQSAILDILEAKYGGLAETVGNTTAGSYQKLKVAVGNYAEVLGQATLGSEGVAGALTDQLNYTTMLTQAVTDGTLTYGQAVAMNARVILSGYTQADAIRDLTAMKEEDTAQTVELTERQEQLSRSYRALVFDTEDAIVPTRDMAAALEENARASEQAARATDAYHLSIAAGVQTQRDYWQGLNTGIDSTIENALRAIEFAQAGGHEIQTQFGIIQSQLEMGIISPETAAKAFEGLYVQAEGLKVRMGEITADEAAANIAATLGVSLKEALDILNKIKDGANFNATGNVHVNYSYSGDPYEGMEPPSSGAGPNSGGGSSGTGGGTPPAATPPETTPQGASGATTVIIQGNINNTNDAFEMAKEINRLAKNR